MNVMGKEKEKKLVEAITPMDEDFAQWYTDVVKKAELVDYASVRGCMVIRPYGYAIWEHIQKNLDTMFKETGHENVYMPMFIPESLLQKEADHVEGFAPEVAWVTHGGSQELTERLCVRPTSETLFCDHYSKIIQSYKDLPKLYNQWCSVVRWEKTTRPFLRTTEFLWQEGHTAHATAEEAQEETIKMLNVYAKLCEDFLAIPVVKGQKTEKEKFAGAHATYTIESLMHDGKALQCGTSHNFGDGFAKAFNIQYTDKTGKLQHVHQTSWGMTTRLIGAMIMVHGDDSGLVIPPRIAPTQLMIIPIAMHKAGVLEKASELKDRLAKVVRVKMDDSDKMPGWKFSEYEMKGVPLRLEIGPKDIENNQAVLVRRDNREKIQVSLDELETKVQEVLEDIQNSLLEKARTAQEAKTSKAVNMEEFKTLLDEKPGFVKAMWCGDRACEDSIKETAGATSRCMPFEQEEVAETCVCCGKPAKKMVYWGRAY
jgi:prolyl-tRNA synthetase